MWVQGEPLLLVYEIGHEIYTTQGIDLPALERLEAAGLLSMDAAGYVKKWFGKHTRLFYFGKPTKIQFPQDASNQLDLGHVILTEQGKALARGFRRDTQSKVLRIYNRNLGPSGTGYVIDIATGPIHLSIMHGMNQDCLKI